MLNLIERLLPGLRGGSKAVTYLGLTTFSRGETVSPVVL